MWSASPATKHPPASDRETDRSQDTPDGKSAKSDSANAAAADSSESTTAAAATDPLPSSKARSGQRELLLVRSASETGQRRSFYQPSPSPSSSSQPPSQQPLPDDKRKIATSRPPVSYRPLRNDGTAAATTTSSSAAPSSSSTFIPPIRSFRSSGSRKSLGLDMSLRSPGSGPSSSSFDDADGYRQRDRTLRALEGRAGDDELDAAAASASNNNSGTDSTGDLFLRIAREDSRHASSEDDRRPEEDSSVVRSFVLSLTPDAQLLTPDSLGFLFLSAVSRAHTLSALWPEHPPSSHRMSLYPPLASCLKTKCPRHLVQPTVYIPVFHCFPSLTFHAFSEPLSALLHFLFCSVLSRSMVGLPY